MDHPRYFKILADLTHFYTDHRSSCHIFVNVDKMKVVNDLKLHITKLFNISNFDVRYMHHHLPDAEDIRILKDGDTVHLIKVNTDKERIELVENEQNCIQEKLVKKVKKKKKKSNKSNIGEPVDFFELTPNSTSSPNSKEEEVNSAPINGNVSHDLIEKVDYFETLEHKNKKRKLDEATPKMLRMNKTYHPLCRLEKTSNIVKTIIASKPSDGKKISNVTIDIIPFKANSESGNTTMQLEDKIGEEQQSFSAEAKMMICQTPQSNKDEEMQETPCINMEQDMQETPIIINKEQEICETPSNKDKEQVEEKEEVFVNTLNVNLSKSELTDISDFNTDSMMERTETNRKRKRVRKRKNSKRLESSSSEKEQPKVLLPFKPPNTQGKPSTHIKFDDIQDDIIFIDSSVSVCEQKNDEAEKTNIQSSTTISIAECNNTAEDVNNASNFSTPGKMQPLEPKPNDKIVFKRLKIGRDYSPILSESITGIVESFNGTEISLNIIEGASEFLMPGGKFNMTDQDEQHPQLKKTLEWAVLIEPIIKRN
ncbi:PREDICTED: uncharacterized protein LOC108559713 [Nicrophorus vespilloides]|uniref:Uncharacterized protein LOC108559713 n=1 Tax=Nicrophorus vespilloides TaxID=110193 RepID=A0ABM1MD91_NICVS|nr:PREDICTED: uncharacterized protein LOC108559713 [Nicrophorus vespilloides]